MEIIWYYSIISVAIVSLLSFIGIIALTFREYKVKKILIYLVSFSAGALIGDVFLHLLPSTIENSGLSLAASIYLISGMYFTFIVEKIIHWRHCHFPENNNHIHPFALVNLWGDSVHNFIDGLIIGASYLVSLEIGIATTLAVILHEIPQEIGDLAIFLHGGASKAKALFFNFLSGLTAIIGLAISFFASSYIPNITTFLIPFSAGSLLYIAGSDLIPELHKEVEAKKSLLQFALLVAGVIVMMALLLLE